MKLPDRSNGISFTFDNKSCFFGLDNLWYRTTTPSNHWSAASQSLDHHQTERFRPTDWEKKGSRIPEKTSLFAITNLANKFHLVPVNQWFDFLLKISNFCAWYFCSYLQWHLRSASNFNRDVGALFGCEAA